MKQGKAFDGNPHVLFARNNVQSREWKAEV